MFFKNSIKPIMYALFYERAVVFDIFDTGIKNSKKWILALSLAGNLFFKLFLRLLLI